jgi:hypothetical protein
VRRIKRRNLFGRDPVVPRDVQPHGRVDLAETLDQVVGEGVVIVDQDDHAGRAEGCRRCRVAAGIAVCPDRTRSTG